MARWLVSQGDRQFTAQDLEELKQLAREGKVSETDMIQPPGASDWVYASEIPELKGLLNKRTSVDSDDLYDEEPPSRSKLPIALALLLVIGAGGYAAWHFQQQQPDISDYELLGDKGVSLSELIVTEAAPLLDKPDGSQLGIAEKDSVVAILGKRKEWYHIQTKQGQEGYVRSNQVVAAYMFADSRTQLDYDPLYNPDKYISVKNASWLQLDTRNKNLTIFQFMIHNQSKFPMTDLMLVATIKDKNGRELERVEIPVEGTIPPHEAVMVGTLGDEEDPDAKRLLTTEFYGELLKDNEDLALLWSDGVEVEMQTSGFTEASIDILEVRAEKID